MLRTSDSGQCHEGQASKRATEQGVKDELDKLLGPIQDNADGDWMMTVSRAHTNWGRVREILSTTSPSTWGRGRLHAIIRKDGPADIVISLITMCRNTACENYGGTYPLHDALRIAAGREVSTVGARHFQEHFQEHL